MLKCYILTQFSSKLTSENAVYSLFSDNLDIPNAICAKNLTGFSKRHLCCHRIPNEMKTVELCARPTRKTSKKPMTHCCFRWLSVHQFCLFLFQFVVRLCTLFRATWYKHKIMISDHYKNYQFLFKVPHHSFPENA